MLLDFVTTVLILVAQDPIAARQLLKELTHRTADSVPGKSRNAVYDYQRAVLEKAASVAQSITGKDIRKWLENLF